MSWLKELHGGTPAQPYVEPPANPGAPAEPKVRDPVIPDRMVSNKQANRPFLACVSSQLSITDLTD